nr:uncharacterized protein LOC124050957 isoform X2 [Scatophagus argus]
MRNETIIQLQAFNLISMEAAFSMEGAAMRDSGSYSCVVLPSKCIDEHEKTLSGNNVVLLDVKGSLLFPVSAFCGVIILMLSLSLCLWCIRRSGQMSAEVNSTACSLWVLPRVESQQANTVVLEEQQDCLEQRDLEAQDGNSFSSTEEIEEYNDIDAEDMDIYEEVPCVEGGPAVRASE